MFGLMSTAAHRRALESQSRVHRAHVAELQAKIDELRIRLDIQRQIFGPEVPAQYADPVRPRQHDAFCAGVPRANGQCDCGLPLNG